MKRFISILFLAISTFLSAQDTTVPIALPITFSKVVEVVYEDFAGTNGRSLSGAFAQAIIQGGTFNPTYEGVKDRLTNFRGYEATPPAPSTFIDLVTISSQASWSPITFLNSGTILNWDVSGAVSDNVDADDPTFNFSSNSSNNDINIHITNTSLVTEINLSFRDVTSITITNNITLTKLFINNNELTILNLSDNTNLTNLELDTNQITSLNINNNTELNDLLVRFNNLVTLDLSTNIKLDFLAVTDNNLTSLVLTNNTLLTNIDLTLNPLTSLDLSTNVNLITIGITDTELTTLDLSTNILLVDVFLTSNNLTTLSISNNPLISTLHTNNNGMTETSVNNILIQLDTNGLNDGTLKIRNNKTGTGITAYNNLIGKNWTIIESSN